MDVDALIEAIARSICESRGINPDDQVSIHGMRAWEWYSADARAALRVAVGPLMEDAAGQCREYAGWHNKMDDGLSGFDKMALGAEECGGN